MLTCKHIEFDEIIKKNGTSILDENYLLTKNEKKLYIFDLDNTLYLREVYYDGEYHKYIKDILLRLYNSGKILCMASHNNSVNYYLREMGVSHLFTHVIGEYPRNKGHMVEEILGLTGMNKTDTIFFDDIHYNIKDVSDVGVESYHITSNMGILEIFI